MRSLRCAFGVIAVLCLGTPQVIAQTKTVDRSTDPHYIKPGFFDVHYCHWSDRPDFFLVLFSTTKFSDVERIETFYPDGSSLGALDLDLYRVLERAGKPVKRVFMKNFPAGKDAPTGWYTAKVTMKDGTVHEARDFVYIISMDLAKNVSPPDKSENIAVPNRLSWDPVPGASYYRVFVWDMWDDRKQILDSHLITKPWFDVPTGLLKKGGWYQWSIHARDVNEHVLLGDFNHGSNLVGLQFTTGD